MEFELERSDLNQVATAPINRVPILNKTTSYNEIFTKYIKTNVPFIIKDVTTEWDCAVKWLTAENEPNFEYLRQKYATCDVTIYNCDKRHYNSQTTETVKFDKFISSWDSPDSKNKYLKDWHLRNTFKSDDFYQVPIYFASDWLNEFLIHENEDDYRFVYIGPVGSWTPFHADVFNSFSWSANVCGRKRWVLFPPKEEDSMRDHLNNLPYDIQDCYQERKHFELIQNQGEAIFIPSGWYHQVWNLEDTISVNHNWLNGCNVMGMFLALEENLKQVKKEIDDCRDMEDFVQHCQIVLKASFGMNFFKFLQFLEFIALRRLEQIKEDKNDTLFHGHHLGRNHAIFDLKAILPVLEKFSENDDAESLLLLPKITMLIRKIQ